MKGVVADLKACQSQGGATERERLHQATGKLTKRSGQPRWSVRVTSGSKVQLCSEGKDTNESCGVEQAVQLIESELKHLQTLPPQSAYVRTRKQVLRTMLQLAAKAK